MWELLNERHTRNYCTRQQKYISNLHRSRVFVVKNRKMFDVPHEV